MKLLIVKELTNIEFVEDFVNKKIFGNTGEDITCKFLVEHNYRIIERNFYYSGGEIDIIAYDTEKKELVFFEVKTRSTRNYGLPSEAISNIKIKRILKGARYYMHIHNLDNANVRFDVIELYFTNQKFLINHIKQII